MLYDIVLFDLDGTITDSGPGIINSVQYALDKYDIKLDKEKLNKFIGPPLHKSFEMFCNFSEEKAMEAVDYYREYYIDKGIYENSVYKDIKDVLKTLKDSGKRLFIATSKPEHFANIVIKHFDLEQYFEFVAGSNMDGSRTKKKEVIQYCLDKAEITSLTRVVMIGDRNHDIIGANKLGIDSIGVLYGYGSLSELKEANATYIAKYPWDILKYILD